MNRANFEKALRKQYSGAELDNRLLKLDEYYDNAADITYGNHSGDVYVQVGPTYDGVAYGTIDEMFSTGGILDGGGIQFMTPYSADTLEKYGLIRKIK